jgi:hypothetical protein
MASNRTRATWSVRTWAPCAALVFALTAASALAGEGYRVPWSTLDSGGGRVQSASGLRIDATLGQPEPELVPLCSADGGAACAGARYRLRGGFWPGWLRAEPGAGCAGAADCLFRDGFETPPPPGGTPAPLPHR